VAAATRLARVRHVWHLREFFHEFGPWWKVYRLYMLACADRVLCVSTPVAAQFPADTGKVEVLHNGLPLEDFEPVPVSRVDRFRAQHGLAGWRLAGVVGRIKAQRKGQDVFVEAVAELRRRGFESHVRFVIVGLPFPGNEEHLTGLRKQISSLGLDEEVVLTGEVEDIQAAMASLDILVLPSAAPEPFGGVVLEAMALGVPVVGTRAGGTIEQVDDGRTGLLVAPGNALELADAIERLLIDEAFRRSAGRAGRRRVEERFAFPGMMARLEGCYQEVMSA
jgi:glycosyltransferase involved in cell wall biosynthesis